MKVFSSDHEFDYSWEEVSAGVWRKYCPWNSKSDHVIAVDTLSRSLDEKSGILRTERLITCKQSAPRWLSTFLGGTEVSHVYEVSYVTPPPSAILPKAKPAFRTNYTATRKFMPSEPALSSRSDTAAPLSLPPHPETLPSPPAHPAPRTPSITMLSTNLTWNDLLSVQETVTYTPSPTSPDAKTGRTRFEQNARITALCGGWQKVKEKIESFTVERFGQNAERGKKGFEDVLAMSRRVFGEERERERLQRENDNARL